MAKKKVVYLFGAGATHAVVKSLDPEMGLLTADVQKKIEELFTPRGIENTIWNELISENVDVEHLISVLESQHNYSASEKLRKFYRDAIVKLSEGIPTNPFPTNLYSVLLDLHHISDLEEELLSCITLNYEDVLERTIKVHFGYDIDYVLKTGNSKALQKHIRVYKLHGSFNWLNSRPVKIKRMSAINSRDTLWIPPGVEKRKDNYPFNLLWGKVIEELLNCDILRIIGCSLSRNDWGLIPVLYTIQKFNQNGKNVEIEVIDYPDTAKTIQGTYRYLITKGLLELPEILNFYKKQFSASSPDNQVINEIKGKFKEKSKINPFQEWLDAKADYLLDKEFDLKTKHNFLYNFYHKTV